MKKKRNERVHDRSADVFPGWCNDETKRTQTRAANHAPSHVRTRAVKLAVKKNEKKDKHKKKTVLGKQVVPLTIRVGCSYHIYNSL